jgi:hypothetical protein
MSRKRKFSETEEEESVETVDPNCTNEEAAYFVDNLYKKEADKVEAEANYKKKK